MTLDICKLLFNVVNKQMNIQHHKKVAGVYKIDDVPQNIKDAIAKKYGEDFLGDANILLFFKGDEDKKSIKKLFKTVDNALGNDANLLVVGDFKKLDLNSSVSTDDEPEETAEPVEDSNPEEPIEGDEEVDDNEKEIQDDIDEVLNEDDDSEEEDSEEEDSEEDSEEEDSDDDSEESQPANDGLGDEEPEAKPGQFIFLKVTLKN